MGLTTLFCEIDDFCRDFEPEYRKHLIDDGKLKRVRKSTLIFSQSYHSAGYCEEC